MSVCSCFQSRMNDPVDVTIQIAMDIFMVDPAYYDLMTTRITCCMPASSDVPFGSGGLRCQTDWEYRKEIPRPRVADPVHGDGACQIGA